MKIREACRAGFTLVELIVVVAIIGLLAAVAVPHFARARTASEATVCIDNLRQIDSAIHRYALIENVDPTATVSSADIASYLGCTPICPAGGSNATFTTSYKISNCQTKPGCLIVPATHVVPN